MSEWNRMTTAWTQGVSRNAFHQILNLPALSGTRSQIKEAGPIRLRMIEELLVLVSEFPFNVEEGLFDWMLSHSDAGWWITNFSIPSIQISEIVGFSGLARLSRLEAMGAHAEAA